MEKSLIEKLNRSGHNTIPRGTPDLTVFQNAE
jgi:hypothetical protein